MTSALRGSTEQIAKAIEDPDRVPIASAIEIPENLTNLNLVVKAAAQRETDQKVASETRYYISSLPGDAAKLLEATRHHWRIENSCHWVLDVAFREDASRIRKDNSGENFAIVRRIALNLLKSEKSTKLGVANKRLKAAWDKNYLTTTLATLF